MKRFISFATAIVVLSSILTTATFAEALTNVTIKTTKTAITIDEYNTAQSTELTADEYDAYKISVSMENIGTIQNTNEDGDITGRQLRNAQYTISFDDIANLDTTATRPYKRSESTLNTKNGNAIWEDKKYTLVWDAEFPGEEVISYNEIEDAFVLYFAIKKGKVANVTVDSASLLAFLTYDEASVVPGSQENYDNVENAVIYSPASFTIGEAAPQDVEVSSLVLNAETKTIETNATFDLTATINADATNKAIAFTVTDEEGNATEGATISAASVTAGADGTAKVTVTGVTAGKYKVTATAGSLSKTCVVTVNAPTPAGFTFSVNDVVVGSEGVAGISVTTVESEGITGGLNGLVWDKCVLSNINTNLYKYVAKFTADDVEPKLSALTNLPETEGASITFDTVLKFADEVKTNVKLTVEQAAK